MKGLIFAKRNLKEILRDPLSLIFCFAFPVVLFLIFELIASGIGEENLENTPQFKIENLTPGIAMFSFSFLSLFSGMVLSKDRTTSFLARLRTSPMTSTDFIIGYTLPMLPIALIQLIVSYTTGIIFGLEFSGRLLISILTQIPIALLFISLGLLFGSIFSDKALGGMNSLVINLAGIFGGVFMPIDLLGGAIKIISYSLPFANSLKLTSTFTSGNYNEGVIPLIIVLVYTIALITSALIIFKKKINGDNV